jgi:tetratricopeptide (TPR) repeat protein
VKSASPAARTRTLRAPSRFEDSLYKAATELPPAPSTRVRTLDKRWDRVVMRCLALSPGDRLQTAEEVQRELTKKHIPKTPFAVAAALLLVMAALFWLVPPLHNWAAETIHPPNVRLAVLPYNGPKELSPVIGGALQEAAERIQRFPIERRSVIVIPPSQMADMHANTPQQARELLHATHALILNVHNEGENISAQATVIDLSSQVPIRELSARYPPKDVSAIPAALTGLVARSFRLQARTEEGKLSPPATEPYLKGVYFLHRDIRSSDEAIAQFQQARRLDPNSALPTAGLALALAQKFDVTRENPYLEQARELVDQAQSRNPDSVKVLLASATVETASSQYLKALQDYRRVQELEPRNVDALLGLATTYDSLREPDAALSAFRKAQELDPEYYKPYYLLMDFYFQHGRFLEAAQQAENMIARAPGLPDSYSALGAALLQLGRDAEADVALQQSLKIRETSQALNNLGALRCIQGRYEEAAAYQKRSLAFNPNSYLKLTNLADNLRWAGHVAEARTYYSKAQDQAKQAMTLDPQFAAARAYFAYTSARLGDTQRAMDEIRQAINLAPKENFVLELAIRTYEPLGARDLALQALREVTPGQTKWLLRNPDLADFCQDPRFKQQMIDKGGQ